MFKAIEIREPLLSSDPIAMCELLVGLPEVTVLDVADMGDRLRVTVETRTARPLCPGCGAPVVVKDRDTVELTDLPCFGTPAVLVWRKSRWLCSQGCGSFTEQAPGTGTINSHVANTFQFGPNGYAGWSCGSEEIIVGASWTTDGEAIATAVAAGPNDVFPHYAFGAAEYGYVLQNGAVGQEVVLTIDCLVIDSISVDETVTGLSDNCSYTSAITNVSHNEGQVDIEVTNTVDCVDDDVIETDADDDEVDETDADDDEVIETDADDDEVDETDAGDDDVAVLGTTVSEVSADTLPFTGFAAGDTVKLGLLAMLAGGLMLFAVRGRKEEEGAVTDIGGWSNL